MYVYAYDPDQFRITEHTRLQAPAMKVANCLSAETTLDPNQPVAGVVGFGGLPGLNPCAPIPVTPTTWGRLKTLYR
jgi:hypothetical protein